MFEVMPQNLLQNFYWNFKVWQSQAWLIIKSGKVTLRIKKRERDRELLYFFFQINEQISLKRNKKWVQEMDLLKYWNSVWLIGGILIRHSENFTCELGNSDSYFNHLRKYFAERRDETSMSHFLSYFTDLLYAVLTEKIESNSVWHRMLINWQLF